MTDDYQRLHCTEIRTLLAIADGGGALAADARLLLDLMHERDALGRKMVRASGAPRRRPIHTTWIFSDLRSRPCAFRG